MAGNPLDLIEPKVLNDKLPLKPYGVEDWGFVLKTGQVTFVEVTKFSDPPSVYLRLPVVLGVRLAPDADLQAAPEHAGVLTVEDAQQDVLALPAGNGRSVMSGTRPSTTKRNNRSGAPAAPWERTRLRSSWRPLLSRWFGMPLRPTDDRNRD